MNWRHPAGRPRIGISRCLLGDDVRYDGGHRRDRWLTEVLGRFVEWVPVCPELEVGMGVPREPIHLVANAGGVTAGRARVRLLGVTTGTDWTRVMARFSRDRVQALSAMSMCGYVLKKGSPSCGLALVTVQGRRESEGSGRGLFAEALIRGMPDLPAEEEGRLQDPAIRERFVERVVAAHRVGALFSGNWTMGDLVRFHAAHKLQLLVHGRLAYTRLGRLVARGKGRPRDGVAAVYQRWFMQTLARPATPGRHADAMLHALGHLTRGLRPEEREDLIGSIEAYRRGRMPRAVSMACLREYVQRLDAAWLRDQTYFEPCPAELHISKGHDPPR